MPQPKSEKAKPAIIHTVGMYDQNNAQTSPLYSNKSGRANQQFVSGVASDSKGSIPLFAR
jgi:hypothetical protein